jgi:hypothetical protein
MAKRSRVASALVAVLAFLGGCNYGAAFDRATAYQDGFESTGAEVTGDPGSGVEVGSGDAGDAGDDTSPIHTATGFDETSDDDDGATSGESTGSGMSETSGAPQAAPPEIESFVGPPSVWQVGAVELKIAAAGEVEEVELQLEHVPVVTVAGGELAHVWEVLGEQQNGPHLWTAVARGPGGEASLDLEIPVLVPPPGEVQWQLELPADGDLSVGFGVTTIPGGGVVVSGVRASRAIVRRYDGGAVTSTWTPTTWGSEFADEPSIGVDVALAPDGAFVVAANIGVSGVRRRYVAKLTPSGDMLWERAGNVGEEAAGITVDAEGNVYLAGSQLGPFDTTALAVWSWNADGGEPWTRSWGAGESELEEHGAAVAVVNDHVVVVGWQQPEDDEAGVGARSVAVFFTPQGADYGATWISVGEFGGDAALDVVTIGDEFCLAGWAWAANDPQRALVRCSVDLEPTEVYVSTKASIARSIAHNRVGEVVIAGEESSGAGERAFVAALQTWITAEHWNTQPVESGSRAFGVACDEWGACTWTGFTTTDNTAVCVAGGLTP